MLEVGRSPSAVGGGVFASGAGLYQQDTVKVAHMMWLFGLDGGCKSGYGSSVWGLESYCMCYPHTVSKLLDCH